MSYSFGKGILKTLRAAVCFLIPIVIVYLKTQGIADKRIVDLIVQAVPTLGSLTVGGVLLLILDWLRHRA